MSFKFIVVEGGGGGGAVTGSTSVSLETTGERGGIGEALFSLINDKK
jgi:hypothetical protein